MSHIHRRKHTKIVKYSMEKPCVKDNNDAYYDIKKHKVGFSLRFFIKSNLYYLFFRFGMKKTKCTSM